MTLNVTRIDTWAAPVEDKPGGLVLKLKMLAKAGVNLEFLFARRAPEKPGRGVVFVAPIRGAAAARAARQAGFARTERLHTVRIDGPDAPGAGAQIAQALAEEGLNLRGLSATTLRGRFACHIALDTTTDAAKAVRILRKL